MTEKKICTYLLLKPAKRLLLCSINGVISVDQISEDAYQDEGKGISGAENFQADEDRGDEGVGGAAEYCGVAKCPTDHRRDPEDGT